MAQTIAIKNPKNAVVNPFSASLGCLATIARDTKPKGGRAGAITIEPIKIGMELVNRATAAKTPEVAMKTKYEVVNLACRETLSRVRSLTSGLSGDTDLINYSLHRHNYGGHYNISRYVLSCSTCPPYI